MSVRPDKLRAVIFDLDGTLVVDLFDGESKEQIWQSVATKTVSEKPEKREKSIPKGVKKTMKKFPIAPVK